MKLRVAKKVVGIVGRELPQRHRNGTAERALRRVEKTESSKTADRFWRRLMQLRRFHMTNAEAERAYDEAPAVPLSADEIRRMVEGITKATT